MGYTSELRGYVYIFASFIDDYFFLRDREFDHRCKSGYCNYFDPSLITGSFLDNNQLYILFLSVLLRPLQLILDIRNLYDALQAAAYIAVLVV